MLKRTAYRKIINEIISNTSGATMLLTPSGGDLVPFYSELNNFFKRSYWMNTDCEDFYSFAVSFSKKVFADCPEEYEKVIQFKHCEYGYNKDSIIIKEALKKIASVYGDCLLVLDNLEELHGDFDFHVIEYILQNSPRNLKILLVCKDLIKINYNIFAEQCPKLIEPETETYSEETVLPEELTEEEGKLLVHTAVLTFVERGYLAENGTVELMDSITKKYPKFAFRRGIWGYCINDAYCEAIAERFGLSTKEYEEKAKSAYYDYLCRRGSYMEAVMFGLRRSAQEMVDEAVVAVVNGGTYTFQLCNFVNAFKDRVEMLLPERPAPDSPGLEFIYGLQLYYNKKYEESLSVFRSVASHFQKNTKFEIDSYYMVMKSLAKLGKFKEIADLADEIIWNRLPKGAPMELFETLIFKLPDFLKSGDMQLNREHCKLMEAELVQEEYKDRYWYAKALQVTAEIHFDWGNYGKATDYIKQLYDLIPFYIIPYKLMGFYYYMGDMHHAVSMAKKALREELNNNIDTDLVDVYILLAKTSIYFSRYAEALDYIDNAIKSSDSDESAKYFAYTLRAIICAKMGKRDYAKDYAMLYAKYAEINAPNYAHYLYGAVAYCAFRLNDFDTAILYANMCIKKESARSGTWLIAVAVAVNILLHREDNSNVNGLMEKLFRSCKIYGMNAIVLDYYECFEKLFKYAKAENIDVEYVTEMEKLYEDKLMQISANGELAVKLMGTTSVTVSGKELNWKTKKAKELFLMYVWHRGEGIDRNFILSTLWPDYVYVSAINNLKTTNNIIRNTLSAANVVHKLEYANGKYSLVLNNIKCDYLDFNDKLISYDDTAALKTRADVCKDLLNALNGGFAAEINLPLFRKHGEHIKEKIMLDVIKLISDLIDKGEIIEARRMINSVAKADVNNNYATLMAEQEKKVTTYFERKE